VLKHRHNVGGSKRNMLLDRFTLFADDVADTVTRVSNELNAVANADERQHG
jgi:hypothetical protein